MDAVPQECREERHSAFTSLTHVLNKGVTYVLNRALFDGTLRPQCRAALSVLPTVVFRAASQRLGSHILFPITLSASFHTLIPRCSDLTSGLARTPNANHSLKSFLRRFESCPINKKALPTKGGLFRNF